MAVAICIPTYNECENIENHLNKIRHVLASTQHTICIVDDGSTDGTLEIVKNYASIHEGIILLERKKSGPGCQRGAATRAGLERLFSDSEHEIFVDLDADGSQRPEELLHGISLIQSGACDVAIASKYIPGAVVRHRPILRNIGSRLYNTLLRSLMQPTILDYSNSYRFYSREAAACILKFVPRYTTPVYLIEMMAIWLSNGFRVVEFPTVYEPRAGGQSKVVLSDVIRGFSGALAVALRYRSGHYVVPGSVGRRDQTLT